MATYNKFNDFVEQLGLAKHDLSAAGHVFKCYLSNTAPDAALDTVKADLAEITAGNGYTAGGEDMQNGWSEASGTATATAVDIVWTAAGGSIGPARYVAAYNDTQTSPVDPLVSWWDYGSSITVLAGETFTVDFGASWFTLA
ncbi:general glycosylation pathway protein [Caudoviricetes sp.]|nr:general glycosylation pathway protein [Caudoviricetes sp.]UOF79652.1 general glycosylation pathway protein [Caudoviricetes sp.]UOF79873.1 general glycosylation pathway protein [Bacteriophage sp.]UOF81323.1 general glycosylation pathway protein [Caudoviricetes sp.]